MAHREGPETARRSHGFDRLACTLESRMVLAHIRKRTVGVVAAENTHPFSSGRAVLVHNGTIAHHERLAARTSAARAAAVRGATDSEWLFAFVCSRLDEHATTAAALRAAVRELAALGDSGSASFLFSDGERLFAHRLGRPLFTLVRGRVRERRAASTAIASQPLTREGWTELPEGALVEIDSRGVRELD
ncbi:MAG: class II glutamine amidotransferase [Polyangiaceae bacterium]